MDVRIEPVSYAEIENGVRAHYATLPAVIDSFLEEHILASAHYCIEIAGEEAGFASVHGGRLVTQFALFEPFRHRGQEVFSRVRRLEQVRSAFVPTCDEFFLAHALDDYRQLAKQAYFFAQSSIRDKSLQDGHSPRLATADDAGLIGQESGDFFADVAGHIAREELLVTLRHERPVGFGLLTRSALYDDVASIGMFTIERYRRSGVGTAIISRQFGVHGAVLELLC